MRQDQTESQEDGTELRRLGAQLKALREAQGLSYDDVTSATHMRCHVVKSIEDGTIGNSMALIYLRGFIKTYCTYLMASDLWQKYSMGMGVSVLSIPDDSEDAGMDGIKTPIEIKHPTAIFRRSSIIWVYIILVAAVAGAAYLLWRQYQEPPRILEPFPIGEQHHASSLDAVQSGDTLAVLVSGDNVSKDASSSDILSIPAPRSTDSASSADARVIASGDLSWMDETSVSARPVVEIPQAADKTLLIEITGSNNRLVVERGGKVLTRRTLGIGSRRSYMVSSDTKVTLSAGNKARVVWLGRRYDSVGSDNSSIVLTFHPNGTVTVEKGKSPHFARPGNN
ncbi:MAG: helix-turn-helix domain-containing protein [Synergistaceae bacterium]|jgi:cytoskeletal protein RodZ|nr:helix-turn-helix domain-containing protein [Synergistaceae bacterium]